MKKYTFAHFMRVYALATCILLIPVLIDRLPNTDLGTQISMVIVWLMSVFTFVIMHLIIRAK